VQSANRKTTMPACRARNASQARLAMAGAGHRHAQALAGRQNAKQNLKCLEFKILVIVIYLPR